MALSKQYSSTATDVREASLDGTQDKQNIANHSLVPCSYTIEQNSKSHFTEFVNDRNINFMYIEVNFSRRMETARSKKHQFFSPGYLIWTYKSFPGAGYPLLGYPYDVKILSLGFLTWYVYDHLQIHVDVAPENCYAEWGDDGTMERLLSTFRDLSNQTIYGDTTSWCYGIKFQWDWMNNLIVHWMRVGRDYTGYMCSTLPESPFRFNEVIKQTRFLFFLQVCGVILLCYSPLLLYIFDTSGEKKKEVWSFYSCLKEALIDESETDSKKNENEDVSARDTQDTRSFDNMQYENETDENKATSGDGGDTNSEDKIKEKCYGFSNLAYIGESEMVNAGGKVNIRFGHKMDSENKTGDSNNKDEGEVDTKSEGNLNFESDRDIDEIKTDDSDNERICGDEEYVGTKSEDNGNCDENLGINEEQECDTDEVAEYFFQGDVHLSFFVLLNGCFEKLKNSGDFKLKWLLKLFFLIVIVPFVLYIKMIVYYFLLRDGVLARMEQDIPVGFVAVPFGFEASRRNWSYFMGGPYVIYGVFFVLAGIVLLCLSDNITVCLCAKLGSSRGSYDEEREKWKWVDNRLERVLHDAFLKPGASHLLQSIDNADIEILGGIEYMKLDDSFKKFTKALKARLYMLFNKHFWSHYFKTWEKRFMVIRFCKPRCISKHIEFCNVEFTSVSECLSWSLQYMVFIICLIPWSVLCFLGCMLDLFSCLMIYGVPIVFLTKSLFVNFFFISLDILIHLKCLYYITRYKLPLIYFILIIFSILTGTIYIYIMFCLYNIYGSSTTYISQTVAFTLMGIVAHPAEASTYIVVVAAIVGYIWKAIDDYNCIYSDLLERTIKISKAIQHDSVKLNEFKTPGIKKSLYFFLVEKHKPPRVEHFLTLLYLCIVISFIWVAVTVVQIYNQDSELDGVIQLGSSIVFGLIPQLIGWCLRSKSSSRRDKLFEKKLRQSIEQYWSLCSNGIEQYENLCPDETEQNRKPCSDGTDILY
ncbi:unnamed protein product [Owenia fusiformis]|uniref:Uncharacterized protein n=1 Tax=Owenia fusiformis TaxID=6347 RepID=A0A8J1UY17_OWEFU|nr:unnamed protein product [Owenia fusiformis]